MRLLTCLAVGWVFLAGSAPAADYKTLRALTAPPATSVSPLPPGAVARPLQFQRIVIHPRDGEAWALAYDTVYTSYEGLLTWDSGRVEGDNSAFERAFDEELGHAGFKAVAGESLFDTGDSASDLKVGVLIDDIRGRYCMDCPNLLYRKGPAATVVMTAHWEIYSSLERKVVAKVTTSGGADFQPKLNDSIMPPVLAAFREHVRQLLASRELRSVVTNTAAGVPGATTQSSQSTIVLLGGSRIARPLSQAMSSVAIIFAADGSGSGFLVSKDGYLLTNRHVVGASRFVKVKWSDGSEVLGEVVRSDARRDIALVKAEAGSRAALALRTAGVELGEAVFAVGTPLGEKQQNTVTKGIVSASRVYDGQPFIQSDVAVTSGNSGGPLLDEKGFVVGLTVSGLAPTGAPIGLNFFIPIDDALRALALRSAG